MMRNTLNARLQCLPCLGFRFPVYVFALTSLGLLLLSFSSTSLLRKASARIIEPAAGETALICVVSSDGDATMNLDAVVLVRNGNLVTPYVEDNEAAQQKFASEYFQAGRKYRLTFGGGEAGTATVQKSDKGCNNIHATVAVETTAKISGQVKGLATNSNSLGKRTSARRAPTTGERAAVMDLVKKVYTQQGVAASQYRSLKVTNLTATDLDGDGEYEMIGSFALALKTKAQRDLFLIARPQGAAMRAEFTKFQAYQPPPEGFLSSIDFVDQFDLDGDGTGEVFAVQGGFDAYGYVIFKKTRGRWRHVYSAMGDAC